MTVAASIPESLTRLNIVREFDAPRALVWKMWTDPAHVGVWFGPEHFTTPVVRMDVSPGGAIHMVMRGPDGSEHPFDGRFIALDEPERLVMRTWITLPDGDVWFEVEHTARFEEIDGRTLMRFQAVVVEARDDAIGPLSGMETGWTGSLNKLAAHVRAVAAAGG
ncbi:MAG: SRPBCC domain-containing protein [Brevundimonas sp.]|uniref:SRPBCC family protein n=1 Tax=Brevundimonas sp. TaxID=1871086 RepID=UPI002486D88B|nr:SRPBCC domain-containing protein [Brevundimonas sp.]MDI1327496.1 SRPBCC domain-containing protein [Brevundimonas sp.]